MEATIKTRDGKTTTEQKGTVNKVFKGVKLTYQEVYYLDFVVNENTGMIDQSKKAKHYTKSQINQNMKALKSASLIAKGAADPSEIKSFRAKYRIAASTLSVVLGFSKNTISNIENEGVTSLVSGRLIKMCIDNLDVLRNYVKLCDSLDNIKKEELFNRLHGV